MKEELRIHKSSAAMKPRPEEADASSRREEANRPMGCGMKLFLFWLGACGLVLLASLVGSLLKRLTIIIKDPSSNGRREVLGLYGLVDTIAR